MASPFFSGYSGAKVKSQTPDDSSSSSDTTTTKKPKTVKTPSSQITKGNFFSGYNGTVLNVDSNNNVIDTSQKPVTKPAQKNQQPNDFLSQAKRLAGTMASNIAQGAQGSYDLLVKPTVDTAQQLGRGLGYDSNAVSKASDSIDASVKQAHDAFVKNPTPKNKANYNTVLSQANKDNTSLVRQATQDTQDTDAARQAGNVAMLGLTAATGGEGAGVVKAGQTAAKGATSLLSNTISQGAQRGVKNTIGHVIDSATKPGLYGAAFGGVGAVQDKGSQTSFRDVAGGTATGIVAGSLLGASVPIAQKFSKGASEALAALRGKSKPLPSGGSVPNVIEPNKIDSVVSGSSISPQKVEVNHIPTDGKVPVTVTTPVRPGIKQVSQAVKVPVNVTTPIRPGIKQISQTDQVSVRTKQPMSDEAYTKQFDTISKSYEKSYKQLEGKPPLTQKEASTSIDAVHQQALDKLDNEYLTSRTTVPEGTSTIKKLSSATSSAGKTTGGTKQVGSLKGLRSFTSLAEKTTGGTRVVSQPTQRAGSLKPLRSSENTETTPLKPLNNSATKPVSETAVPTKETSSGEYKVSGNALRIQQKAVEKKLTGNMSDLPQYKSIDMKDQAKQAVDLISTDRQKAIDIIDGKTNPPGDLKAQSIHQALEDVAIREGDGALLTKLAKSHVNTELSEGAQKLRIAAERDPHSPVEAIRQVQEARIKASGKHAKANVAKEVKAMQPKVASATPKVKKETWASFVESLKC